MVLPACFCAVAGLPVFAFLIKATAANSKPQLARRMVCAWSLLNAISAAVALVWSLTSGPTVVSLLPETYPVNAVFLLDSVSTLMWLLVSGIGWVISSFSVRYLDGDPNQDRYFKWVAFTLSSVSLTVLSANLFLSVGTFLLTSLGLHFLLLHNSERSSARFPAALKFVFSRLGDVCLFGAAVALFAEFGTANLPQLFDAIKNLSANAGQGATVAAALIVFCAIFKSAQFPFHTWLPETMEAPTPVSALMHAGIVNAGGYLLIRTAPILDFSPVALWVAAGLGAFTAFFAAITMQWQASVKRSLAWSTIAQMGFMILQCGLGAFSAAMLHIIAHSLYKAHAFLNSGSVLLEKKSTDLADDAVPHLRPNPVVCCWDSFFRSASSDGCQRCRAAPGSLCPWH
jgi:NAD(P)H-quinone oxidoreductase subunit 5